jgi:hypothetical protein
MEEHLSAIGEECDIEKQLDLLELYKSNGTKVKQTVSEASSTSCSQCGKELKEVLNKYVDLNEEMLYSCECGNVTEPNFKNNVEDDFLDDEQIKKRKKKSKYKHSSYAQNKLDELIGNTLPIRDRRKRSLLQCEDVPLYLDRLKKLAKRWQLDVSKCTPINVADMLKFLKLGRLYKYLFYLTECLNPSFSAHVLTNEERDWALQIFKHFVRLWFMKRLAIGPRYGIVNRKSLPHIPSILKNILIRIGRNDIAQALPEMRSCKRQHLINSIINEIMKGH